MSMYNAGGAPPLPPHQSRKARRPANVDSLGPLYRAPQHAQLMPIMQTAPRVQPSVTQIPQQSMSTSAPRNVLLTQPQQQGQYMHRAPTVYQTGLGLLPVQPQMPTHQTPYMFQQPVFPPPPPTAATAGIHLQLSSVQQATPSFTPRPPAAKPPQRKSHAIRIINPNTMKEVDVAPADSAVPPSQPAASSTSSSSSSNTSAPIEFQRRVHEVAALATVPAPPAPNAIIRNPEDLPPPVSLERNGDVSTPLGALTDSSAQPPAKDIEEQASRVSSERPPPESAEELTAPEAATTVAPATGQQTTATEQPEAAVTEPSVEEEPSSQSVGTEETDQAPEQTDPLVEGKLQQAEEETVPAAACSDEPAVPFVSEQLKEVLPTNLPKPVLEESTNLDKPASVEPVSPTSEELVLAGSSEEPAVPFVSEEVEPASLDKGLSEEPISLDKPASEEPVGLDKPASEEPISVDKPASEEPVGLDKPSSEEPISVDKPASEEPVCLDKGLSEEPISLDKPASEEPVGLDKPASEEPVGLDKPASEEPISVDKPASEEPVCLDKSASEEPVGLDKDISEEPVNLDKSASEEPVGLDKDISEEPVSLDKPAPEEPVGLDKPEEPENVVPPATVPFVSEQPLANGSAEPRSRKGAELQVEAPPPRSRQVKQPVVVERPRDGRTTYERDFLLKFKLMQQCQQPPDELQKISSDLFKPNALRDVLPDREIAQSYNSRKASRRGSEPKRIAHQPAKAEKVDLHKANQRWMRPQECLLEESEEGKATTELYRKFQGILNKLTPQKFQALAEKSLELEINTEDRLRGCIDKIFRKALEEPNFSIAYANLCKVLSPIKVEWTDEEGKSRTTNFRRVLLNKCQQEFEKDKKDDDNRDSMLSQIAEAESAELKKQLEVELAASEVKNQKRSLGNIRFIGELFKLKMLSETIMHECIVRLLRSASDEECLECFARLITTTGKDLDHPQAKMRIDNYFVRINDIIKKGKIPVRIKFMLQDVQALRKNGWVPRSRQDNTLKTIDQIHAEAKAEEERDKHLVAHHMLGSMKSGVGGGGGGGGGGREERRRGNKADEWTTKGAADKDKRAKVDANRISRLAKSLKSKEPTLGPPAGLRPHWKTPAPSSHENTKTTTDKHSKASRFSSSAGKKDKAPPSGRGSGGGQPKRASSQPDSQREQQAALVALKQHIQADQLSEEEVRRRTATILDELHENQDFKEAVECVQELASPGQLFAFTSEAINHSLEKSAGHRALAGRLLERLLAQNVLPLEALSQGFNEVLEVAEDMALDIPRIWEYLAEVLAPLVVSGCLPLAAVAALPCHGVPRQRLASLLGQTLRLARPQLSSNQELKALWTDSQLQWQDFDVEHPPDFLSQLGLEVLLEASPQQQQKEQKEPGYQQRLAQLFSSSITTNDEVFDWIEEHCPADMLKSAEFVRSLTSAVVQATVSGSGISAQYEEEVIKRRVIVIQKYVDDSKSLQLEVLYALQIAVAQLEHPPRLLNQLFNLMYDVEVVAEDVFVSWRDHGREGLGKGFAVQSVKTFFEWLESAETESDEETAS